MFTLYLSLFYLLILNLALDMGLNPFYVLFTMISTRRKTCYVLSNMCYPFHKYFYVLKFHVLIWMYNTKISFSVLLLFVFFSLMHCITIINAGVYMKFQFLGRFILEQNRCKYHFSLLINWLSMFFSFSS